MELKRCSICSFPLYKSKRCSNGFGSVYTCTGCGMGFTRDSTLPTYDEDYYDGQALPSKKIFGGVIWWLRRGLVLNHRLKKVSGAFKAGGSLLDIGCGDGLFVYNAFLKGWRVTALDTNPVAIGLTRRLISDVVDSTLQEAKFPNSSFDVVTVFHVLEHLDDPDIFLDEIHRILKPGGSLVIEVPNFNGFLAGVFGSRWFPLCPSYHKMHFTKEGLIKLLNKCRFSKKVRTNKIPTDTLTFIWTFMKSILGVTRSWNSHEPESLGNSVFIVISFLLSPVFLISLPIILLRPDLSDTLEYVFSKN